ncbi:nitrilase family protein [Robiginitalea sp.]|uniref:nitrilase family protein n=1 Tax=Robiginitalea sp. TaxID=1902411 RepID=UPI003C75F0A9
MRVALIQTSLEWEDPVANRAHFGQLINTLDGGTDLIVLPEMFTTGFTMNPEHIPSEEAHLTLEWMREIVARTGSALAGSLIFPEAGKYFNRLVFMLPDGTYEYYDKRHTFTLAGEDKVYQRGAERKTVRYMGLTFSLQICYDLRFPVWSRNTTDYDVLLFVANWPDTRIGAWDTLLKARAIENMSYVLGVNRIGSDSNGLRYQGHSGVYDALGERLVFSDKEEILYATLDKNTVDQARTTLKFLQDRDAFTLES